MEYAYTAADLGGKVLRAIHRHSPLLLVFIFSMWCVSVAAMYLSKPSDIASVLLGNFETVFYARGDMLSDSTATKRLSKGDIEVMRTPFIELREILQSIDGRFSEQVLRSGESFFVGAKDFRPPAGLGPVYSRRCYVVVLRRESSFSLTNFFRRPPSTEVSGVAVWAWSAKVNEFGEDDPRPSTLYAAQLSGSYLLFANSIEELRIVADGLTAQENTHALPIGWSFVDGRIFWGYRKYRHESISEPQAAGTSTIPPTAQVLLLSVDFNTKAATLRLTDPSSDEAAMTAITDPMNLPRFARQDQKDWQARVPLAGDQTSLERLASIMALFGFGAYV